ncbi:hypothetical protein FB567DRAFT_624222 [Paraphoma chrysanthemicola]|uniref:Clr5 domain-containing protein n=1 Tax=Paraphoma chrysanthemicola TaxID=798071 RepID=A0A8K0RJB6_9PLEO|nr:hypothetical protein FB567DRAFT_624222 [Paraphoma chrysanthemicola]
MAPRISDALWEYYREAIVDLFICRNVKLSGPGGVIDLMGERYGFRASSSQYEARFKQWGLRKKITEPEWRAILPRIEMRAEQGRRTEVMFNGVVLDEERIQRELARRSSSKLRERFLQGADEPQIPPGFAIQSPPPDDVTNTGPLAREMELDDNPLPIEDRKIEHVERSILLPALSSPEDNRRASSPSSAFPDTTPVNMDYDQLKKWSAYISARKDDLTTNVDSGCPCRSGHEIDIFTGRYRYAWGDLWTCPTCLSMNLVYLADTRCPVCGTFRNDEAEWTISTCNHQYALDLDDRMLGFKFA